MQNIEIARQTAEDTMRSVRMYDKGVQQLVLYSILYGAIAFVVLLAISLAVGIPFAIYLDSGWVGIVVFLILCAFLGWKIFVDGGFQGEENIVYFRTCMKAAYTTVGGGRTQNIPRIQRISEDYVSLQRREVPIETEIEIPGQPTEKDKPGHPQTKIMFSMRIYFDVIDAAKYMFLMPGKTTEEKGNVLSAIIKDALQSVAHEKNMDEATVLALSGKEILDFAELGGKYGEKISIIAINFGIEIARLVVDETNIDPEIEELRVKVYEGDMEGQAYLAQVGHMVIGAFGKDMKDMTPEDFEELRKHKERIDFIASMKSGDKTILNMGGILGGLFGK